MSEPNPPPDPLARIEAALEHLGEEHEPPPGWEARVLAATAVAAPARRRWRQWFAAPIAAMAAALLVWVWSVTRMVALGFELVTPSGPVVRGGSGSAGNQSRRVGERLEIKLSGGRGHRELWIYRDERFLMRCPGDARCHSDGDVESFELPLTGIYKIVAVDDDTPPPEGGHSSYDHDVAPLRRDGRQVPEQTITVP